VRELIKIAKKIAELNPDIIKISTMIKTDSDVMNLIKLMIDFPADKKRIVIGMGLKGKITRVMGPILGNFLTYVSTDFGKSAQGQIDINNF